MTSMTAAPAPESRLFALVLYFAAGALAAIVAFTASAGLVDSMPLAAGLALVAAGATIAWVGRRPGLHGMLGAVPRAFRVLFAVGALLLVVQLAALTHFVIDPGADQWLAGVWRPWRSAHSCVSAYWVAAREAPRVDDLSVEAVYRKPIAPTALRRPNLGPFFVDVFEYPPTFLPLPRLLALATPDFWQFRRLWFALNLGAVVLGLIAVARRLDAPLRTQALWLTPFALVSPVIVGTRQAGNVQLLFLVACAVAMLLFERQRYAAGGVLLAYAIVSKLFPGVLLIYLIRRGEWRALAWTAAAGASFAIVTFIDLGATPFVAFLPHLPKLLSGEAFPGLFRPEAIAINESVPGLAFKLGVGGTGFAVAKVIGWLYTIVLIAATWWLARPSGDRTYAPLIWVTILILATMQSPFLPGYGVFPALWLATLLAAVVWQRPAARTAVLALWVVLAVAVGQSAVPPLVNAAATLTHTLASFWLVVMVARLVGEPAVVSASASPASVPALA